MACIFGGFEGNSEEQTIRKEDFEFLKWTEIKVGDDLEVFIVSNQKESVQADSRRRKCKGLDAAVETWSKCKVARVDGAGAKAKALISFTGPDGRKMEELIPLLYFSHGRLRRRKHQKTEEKECQISEGTNESAPGLENATDCGFGTGGQLCGQRLKVFSDERTCFCEAVIRQKLDEKKYALMLGNGTDTIVHSLPCLSRAELILGREDLFLRIQSQCGTLIYSILHATLVRANVLQHEQPLPDPYKFLIKSTIISLVRSIRNGNNPTINTEEAAIRDLLVRMKSSGEAIKLLDERKCEALYKVVMSSRDARLRLLQDSLRQHDYKIGPLTAAQANPWRIDAKLKSTYHKNIVLHAMNSPADLSRILPKPDFRKLGAICEIMQHDSTEDWALIQYLDTYGQEEWIELVSGRIRIPGENWNLPIQYSIGETIEVRRAFDRRRRATFIWAPATILKVDDEDKKVLLALHGEDKEEWIDFSAQSTRRQLLESLDACSKPQESYPGLRNLSGFTPQRDFQSLWLQAVEEGLMQKLQAHQWNFSTKRWEWSEGILVQTRHSEPKAVQIRRVDFADESAPEWLPIFKSNAFGTLNIRPSNETLSELACCQVGMKVQTLVKNSKVLLWVPATILTIEEDRWLLRFSFITDVDGKEREQDVWHFPKNGCIRLEQPKIEPILPGSKVHSSNETPVRLLTFKLEIKQDNLDGVVWTKCRVLRRTANKLTVVTEGGKELTFGDSERSLNVRNCGVQNCVALCSNVDLADKDVTVTADLRQPRREKRDFSNSEILSNLLEPGRKRKRQDDANLLKNGERFQSCPALKNPKSTPCGSKEKSSATLQSSCNPPGPKVLEQSICFKLEASYTTELQVLRKNYLRTKGSGGSPDILRKAKDEIDACHEQFRRASIGQYVSGVYRPFGIRCEICNSSVPGDGPFCDWKNDFTVCSSCDSQSVKSRNCCVCFRSRGNGAIQCADSGMWVHAHCDGMDIISLIAAAAANNDKYRCKAYRQQDHFAISIGDDKNVRGGHSTWAVHSMFGIRLTAAETILYGVESNIGEMEWRCDITMTKDFMPKIFGFLQKESVWQAFPQGGVVHPSMQDASSRVCGWNELMKQEGDESVCGSKSRQEGKHADKTYELMERVCGLRLIPEQISACDRFRRVQWISSAGTRLYIQVQRKNVTMWIPMPEHSTRLRELTANFLLSSLGVISAFLPEATRNSILRMSNLWDAFRSDLDLDKQEV